MRTPTTQGVAHRPYADLEPKKLDTVAGGSKGFEQNKLPPLLHKGKAPQVLSQNGLAMIGQ